jgi:hypothetical protein
MSLSMTRTPAMGAFSRMRSTSRAKETPDGGTEIRVAGIADLEGDARIDTGRVDILRRAA